MPDPLERSADTTLAGVPQSPDAGRPGLASNETARPSDSVPIASALVAGLPREFGRYRVEKVLGKGQMGTVYLANDVQLDRLVALKVARISSTGSAKLLKRMETEAKAAAKVDHPLICKVFDFGEIEGIRYIALQYIEGEDLKSYLKRVGKRREPDEAVRLIIQIAGAIGAAHDKGIIHRDLKPENLMLNKNGEPVVMDFGLARRTTGSNDAGLTQGMIIGSAAYMSPEQATGKADEIDHRSDLYALGVMLYEMLTGEWPFSGNSVEVIGRKSILDPPSPLSVNPNLSDGLASVCEKLLARKKEDRYASCAELIAELQDPTLDAPPALTPKDEDWQLAMDQDVDALAVRKKRPKRKSAVTPAPKTGWITSMILRSTKWSVARWAVIGCIAAIYLVVYRALFIQTTPNKARPETASTRAPAQERVVSKPPPQGTRSADPPPLAAIANSTSKPTEPSSPPPVVSTNEPTRIAESDAVPTSEPESTTAKTPSVNSERLTPIPQSDESDGIAKQARPPSNADLESLISSAAALVKSAKQLKGKEGAAKFKDATMTLKRASNLFPEDIRALFYLGMLHSGVGINDVDEAAQHLKIALERSPGHVPTMNNLALVSLRARKYSIALNYLNRLSSASLRPIEFAQNLGRLLDQSTQLNLKKDELKRFSALSTGTSGFRGDRGWLYMSFDNTDKSNLEFQSFTRDGNLEDQSCSYCGGYGALPCATCGKAGTVFQPATLVGANPTPFGTFVTTTASGSSTACPTCRGAGRVDCRACTNGIDPKLKPR